MPLPTLDIFYFNEWGSLETITLGLKNPENANIDDALTSAFCYLHDPDSMTNDGHYEHDFSFYVFRIEDIDFDNKIGFAVGNQFFGYACLWVKDTFENR